MSHIRTDPPRLPEALRSESALMKFIWVWLRPQGTVRFSTRAVAGATGISQRAAGEVLNRLRARGLIEDLGEHRERVRPTFRAVTSSGTHSDIQHGERDG